MKAQLRKKLRSRQAGFSILALSALTGAEAAIIITTDSQTNGSNSLPHTYTVSSTDLLNGLTPTAQSGTFTQEGTGGTVVLTDGAFPSPITRDNGGAFQFPAFATGGNGGGTSVTYTLANPASIASINVFGGWQDSGRDQQNYTISYATAADPNTFISLTSVDFNPGIGTGNPQVTKVSFTDSTGILASNVFALRFDFRNTENGYSGYSEIDVNAVQGPPPGGNRFYNGAATGVWDYTTPNFFTDQNAAANFNANDVAIFGNLGADGNRTVTVSNGGAGVTPNSVRVDNKVGNNYTISGEPIKGFGGLTKTGPGALTLTGANEFGGLVAIQHGTVNVGSIGDAATPGNLGQGPEIDLGDTTGASDAVLNYTGSTAVVGRVIGTGATGGTINIAAGADLTFSSLTGAGSLTKGGSGNLIFSSTTTGIFTGSIAVTGGGLTVSRLLAGAPGSTLSLGNNGPGQSRFTYGGATLADTRAATVGNFGGTISVAQQDARYQLPSLTATGPVTVGGAGRLAIAGVASFTTFPTIQAGATLALQNESTTTPNVIPAGPITLSAGTLVVAPNALGSNTDAINLAGGTLRLAHEGLNIDLLQGQVNNPADIARFNGTSNNQREYFANNSPAAFTGRTTYDGHTTLDFSNAVYGAGAPFGATAGGPGLDPDTDNIRANFTGKILITTGGDTTFFATSDDGSGIYIDGQRVVNNNAFQGQTTRQGTINLTPGLHDIQIYFYEGQGGAGLNVEYTPVGGVRQTIPNSVLYAGDTYTDLRPINVTASSSLETGGTATLGALTQANNTMLTTVGNLNFAGTTLSGAAGTYSIATNALSMVNLGAITATNATINKTGNGALIFNSAPAGLILNANGGLVVAQGSEDGVSTTDPLAGAVINYNGGGIGFSATAGNPTYTENIVTANDYQVEAGRFGSGMAGPTIITWAPTNNVISVAAGKTATFSASTTSYTFNVDAPVAADGTVVINEGNLSFNSTATFRASEGLTVNLASVAINGPVTTGALKVTGDYAGAQGTSSLYVPGLAVFGTVNATSVTVSGSSLTVGDTLTNTGALTISSGTAHFQGVANNASITQTGGAITADQALKSTGATTVSNGSLTVGDVFNTSGLAISGGAVNVAGNLTSTAAVSVNAGSLQVGGVLSAPSLATGASSTTTLASGALLPGGTTIGVGSTLNLDSGSGQTRTVTGGVTVAQGTVNARTGTTDFGTSALTVTPRTFTPGLLEGVILNTPNGLDLTTPNLGAGHTNSDTGGIRLSTRMGETNIKDTNNPDGNNHWADNETWVYTGQFFDLDGKFTFAENIDDQVSVKIDGAEVLRNTAWNVVTSTNSKDGLDANGATAAAANTANANTTGDYGMGPLGDGWHEFEVRFMNGGGGAGTAVLNGWGGGGGFDNKGFGFNTDAITGLNGGLYTPAADGGDGLTFRVVAGGGTLNIESGATIAVGSTTGASLIALNGAAGDGNAATLKLNDLTVATSSTADSLKVTGSLGAQGIVDIGNKGQLTVGNLVFADGTSLEKKGVGTMIVSGAINGVAVPAKTTFVNSAVTVSGGKMFFNGVSEGAGSVTAFGFGTVGGTGSVPTLSATNGGTIAPGADGVGILTTNGDLTMSSDSTLSLELASVLSSDSLVVNGGINLSNTALQVKLLPGFSDSVNDLFFILLNDGNDAVNGTFAGATTLNLNGAQFKVLYTANSDTNGTTGGNDIALQALNAVPEPGSMMMLMGGLGVLGASRRFRSRVGLPASRRA